MRLKQLQIKNFRNLHNVHIKPVNGVNLIIGKNASGKTSLLETIYYLSHLRSFRTNSFSDVLQRDKDFIQLVARISTSSNQEIPLGLEKTRNSLEIRANKQPVRRVADVAALFPVISIHPDSYQLITGGPSERRSFLDWGVFHVEHDFYNAWQRYKTALNQRNAALKSRQNSTYCMSWDKELVQAAKIIDKLRAAYLAALTPYLQKMTKKFFPNHEIEFEYRRGWGDGAELGELLSRSIEKDLQKCFTYYGPHRADLVIKVDGHSAQYGISRGQQKLMVALLRLSQAIHYSEQSALDCVLLYDDLAAELDSEKRQLVLSVLAEMKIQLFLTCVDPEQLDLSYWKEHGMFHVEHGNVKAL